MPAIYNQVLLQWQDVSGKQCSSFWTTQDQTAGGAGAYATLKDKAEAISCCGVIGLQFQVTITYSPTPVTGAYCSVLDRAVFRNRIPDDNQPSRIEIPGPKAGIFLPDLVTVDLSNTDVLAFQSEVMAVLGGATGHAMGPFKKGIRARARAEP
jgi:hypothetical protein